MSQLNWGIIGTGWIGNDMADALNHEHGTVYAVAATSQEKADTFAAKHGVLHAYGSAEDLLNDPAVDIVYIATPHASHYQMMKKALEAGKHVFSEKSVTVNSRQLEECVEIAKKNHLTISDGTTLLHMPLYHKVKELIDSKALGAVKMIDVTFGSDKEANPANRFFNPKLAGGALLDIGVYACSFARFFMSSMPTTILSDVVFYESGVDETSGILLKNPQNEMAVISLTFRAKQPKRGIVACEKGYITIDDFPRAQRATITWTEDGRKETIEAGVSDDALRYEVQDMERYVKENDGEKNLEIVRDTMKILSNIRRQWNLVYDCE